MRRSAHRVLLIVGIAMLAIAAVGFFLRDAIAGVTTFAVLGAAVLIVAVFEPRVKGTVKLGPSGVEITVEGIQELPSEAELQLEKRTVRAIDEVIP